MNGKKPNAEEAKWLDAIMQLGCIVCMLLEAISLCARHHRIPGHGYETRHGNKARFWKVYGTDVELLKKERELINL